MDMLTLAMAKAYTDSKGGYSKIKKNILLPLTTLPAGKSVHEAETESDWLDGFEGQIYTVLFDGVKYPCEVKQGDYAVGLFTESFKVQAGRGFVDITVTDATADHTIEIYQETETIVPIDQMYLPGVCLPVVEISGDIDMETLQIPCTVTESAAFDAAVKTGMPVVLKISALAISAVASFADGGYIFSYDGMTIACRPSDEGWLVNLEQN